MSKYVDENGSEKRVVSVVRTENIYTGEIDEKFSNVSTNPIENKAITNGILKLSSNLLDASKVTENAFLSMYNEEAASSTRCYSDYIKVNEGDIVSVQQNGSISSTIIFQITAFDSSKTYAGSSKGSANVRLYNVPEGVSYIRISFNNHNTSTSLLNDKIAVVISDQNVKYEEFGTYKIKNDVLELSKDNVHEFFREDKINIDELSMTYSRNLFNKDGEISRGYVYNGNIYENDTHFTSDYIEVKPNTTYSFTQQEGVTDNVRFLCEYDENKVCITNYNESPKQITTKANAKYIRVSFYKENLDNVCVKEGSQIGFFTPYVEQIHHKYIDHANNLIVFLPKDIYCAVGRTIEIYNKQVCINIKKYNVRWKCRVGSAYERKFSVQGTTSNIGDYKLELGIYDDDMNVVWYGSSTLHIVSDSISENTKLLPIGDSLTELGGVWLEELYTLSNNIVSVGTRTNSNSHNNAHEGRSGWTTQFYLTKSSDSSTGKTNSFWNPNTSSFDYAYYKTAHSINPDIIQIFLGTNDLLNYSKEEFGTYIKEIIDNIRSNDAEIPIMIVLTITWGNQNGIGAEGSVRTMHGRFKYNLDKIVLEGVEYLFEFLNEQNYTNVFFVPMTQCHDSEYNFGAVNTPVNPRATQTESIPVEAVHPQAQGYLQFADVIFSAIAYIKNR